MDGRVDIHQALAHHQAGRLAEAERAYRWILDHDPANADALHLLGVLKNDPALIRRAIQIRPQAAEFHLNLGNLLRSAGQVDQAIDAFSRAVQLRPNQPELLNNLGEALRGARRYAQAIQTLRQAAMIRQDIPEVYYNLGLALADAAESKQAAEALARAVQLRPSYFEAYSALGKILRQLGAVEESIACHSRGVQLRPDSPEEYFNLGVSLSLRGRVDEAIGAYDDAIRLNPDYADAYCNLASLLQPRGQTEKAMAAARKAIELNPALPAAHANLANVYKDCGQIDQAIAECRRAIDADPTIANVHSNLIYTLHYQPGQDPAALLAEARRYNLRHAAPLKSAIRPHGNDRSAQRRLRIGYVSADFSTHVVGRNILPLFREHDHAQFEIFCYSAVQQADALTERFRACADHWRQIAAIPDDQVADTIRADGIDILVDLALHTSGGRLLVFARKPAPVQVTFGGYPGGTGLDAMDYRLTDPHLDPPDHDAFYVEKSLRLPHSFWCYDTQAMSLNNTPSRPVRNRDGIVFGCLNNFAKVNDVSLDLWRQVLDRTPGSRIILLAPPGPHRQKVSDKLGADRLEWADRLGRDQYLALHGRIDIALDTFPYNGHTTSLDSFWMGAPVVTLVGQTAVSRAGWSHLCNLGLRELAAQTPREFVNVAVGLAHDLPRLLDLQATLRDRLRASPLMDAPNFARNIESKYRDMWRAWTTS